MPSKLIVLRQPEGGAEHGMVYVRSHRCGRAVEGKDDLLVFPVGNVGYGMPRGVPFQVTAVNECELCGRLLTAWFEWASGSHFL